MWGQFHRGDAHSISINLAAKLHTMHSPTCQNPGVARLEDMGAVARLAGYCAKRAKLHPIDRSSHSCSRFIHHRADHRYSPSMFNYV
jgi:hypothetical protein